MNLWMIIGIPQSGHIVQGKQRSKRTVLIPANNPLCKRQQHGSLHNSPHSCFLRGTGPPFRTGKPREQEKDILANFLPCVYKQQRGKVIFTTFEYSPMNDTQEQLNALFHRIPRRHTADNVKEIYSILDEYEQLLQTMEADARYEQKIAPFFDALDPIRATVKKSNDNKASKKAKDTLFDEASGALKDTMQEVMAL